MGVPGFFSWLLQQCKQSIIFKKIDTRPTILYIDGNCLIHPKCYEVLEFCTTKYKNVNLVKMELLMFKRITKFIDYLINISNAELCYFAIDGVAPLAKINQQRKRRYKTMDDTQMKNKIKEKYNIPITNIWNNTVITPGTEWMERLHNYLLDYFKDKPNIIYSSYHEAGEGEHKILKHIKNNMNKKNINDTIIIYGLDADLFFLAMASQKPNIYLLREEQHFDKHIKPLIEDIINDVEESMNYVSIDITKYNYDILINDILYKKTNIVYNISGWTDFIFLCYLLGNDFLPHLPTIDIHKCGLDILLEYYTDTFIRLNMCLLSIDKSNKVFINNIFLLELLRLLGTQEERYYIEILPEYDYKKQYRKCKSQEPYQIELWDIENMKINIDNPLQLGKGTKEEWKYRYYEYYFGVDDQLKFINNMCKKYIEGLLWVAKYYFEECPAWEWQYEFTHAPFISDIYNYYTFNKTDINKIKFVLSKPLSPCTQLLAVVPPSCSDILPINYKNLIIDPKSPIKYMYPDTVYLDMLYKDSFWMCVPMLPVLEIDKLKNIIHKIKLTKEENERNQ